MAATVRVLPGSSRYPFPPPSTRPRKHTNTPQLVQSWGLKIDGVGLQGHMVTESTPTQDVPTPSRDILADALRIFTDLGVDVAYTEVDIRMNTPATAAKLEEHAAAFGRMMGACMDVESEFFGPHFKRMNMTNPPQDVLALPSGLVLSLRASQPCLCLAPAVTRQWPDFQDLPVEN
ncbi:endo-1,4-beta-xylanase [Candidatus Bathyarchaeota archaeon]|nr:endo-1,4-beta-xylanase [Candidatus Bathyarchaeota archaeon]